MHHVDRRRLLMHAPFGKLHGGSRYHAVAARRFSDVEGLVSGGEDFQPCRWLLLRGQLHQSIRRAVRLRDRG